jgi:hypothetical protein
MVFIIAIVIFARTFIVAGRLQDKFRSLPVSLTEGLLIGLRSISYATPQYDGSCRISRW